MSGFLLDTNVVIWALYQSNRIGAKEREALLSRPVWISHVSVFEIAIKLNIGRLPLPAIFTSDFKAAVEEVAGDFQAELLPTTVADYARLSRLPYIHRDPFDRLIISQALSRNLTVVTGDRIFTEYAALDVLEI